MVQNSKIEWTDHTFNPVIGCAKVAAGCQYCYAEALAKRMPSPKWGTEAAGGVRVRTSDSYWREPLAWNRKAEKAGRRSRVFCASLSDVFEDWGGSLVWHDGRPVINRFSEAPYTMADVRADLFRLIDRTPWLDWLLLTKRPENIRRFAYDAWTEKVSGHVSQNEGDGRRWKPRGNVWLGTSIAVQADADANIPALQKCRELSPVLFLSCEPLLGPVDLKLGSVSIDWVIAGGESGPDARPMHPAWARSLRDQCQAESTPFFFKQWGEYRADPIPEDFSGAHACCLAPCGNLCGISFSHGQRFELAPTCATWDYCDNYRRDWVIPAKVGKQAAGRVLDGVTHDEMPRFSLEVRQ